MRQILIQQNDAGQRLDKFLQKVLKDLPETLMHKYIRKKCIKLNGKRCKASDRLQVNDLVNFYIKDEFFGEKYDQHDFLKAPVRLNIVYEDANILLVNKNPGLLVHPDENYHFDTLIARIQHYLYDKGEYDPKAENSFAPALVNRIDRNTCGIVIAVKNAEALRILNNKMKKREIAKFYLCLVHGYFCEHEKVLTAFMTKDDKSNRVFITNKNVPESKVIKTKYKVLNQYRGISLLEVELLTGRTHQIRAHMAFVGHPIVGDGKYGKADKALGFKYQALCAYKLVFKFESEAGILQYLANKEFKLNESDEMWQYYRRK